MSLLAKVVVVLLLISVLFVVVMVNSSEKPENNQKIGIEEKYKIIKTENITAAIAPLPEGSSLMYLLAAIPLILVAKLAHPP